MDNQATLAKVANISSKLCAVGIALGEFGEQISTDSDTQKELLQLHRTVTDGQRILSDSMKRLGNLPVS